MAQIATIKTHIENTETAIAKKTATIAKKQALIEKKKAKYEVEIVKATDDQEKFKANWLLVECKSLEEDIVSLEKQIAEKKVALAKYTAQLETETEKDDAYTLAIPECMKKMEAELVETWDAWDLEARDEECLKSFGMTREEYKAEYGNEYGETNEEVHRKNVLASKELVRDLYNRIHAKTGNVTSWNGIRAEVGTHGFTVLNGVVRGEEGVVRVESIYAGGYNIQRLHVRVLVHAY